MIIKSINFASFTGYMYYPSGRGKKDHMNMTIGFLCNSAHVLHSNNNLKYSVSSLY